VEARRFSAPDDDLAGSSGGSIFPVYSSGSEASLARVAMNDAKQAVIGWNFVVVSTGERAGDVNRSIYMSMYDGDGNVLVDDVRISAPDQIANIPRVERNDDGFVVVWQYENPYKSVARRFG
jgi:hypothetical protein